VGRSEGGVPWWCWLVLAAVFTMAAMNAGQHVGLRRDVELFGWPLAVVALVAGIRELWRTRRQH
jgi:uncharacterized membrane protein YfcA